MKTNRLLDAMGNIQDQYIKEAWLYAKPRRRRSPLALVACGVLAVGIIGASYRYLPWRDMLLGNSSSQPGSSHTGGLPLLDITQAEEASGFEGYMVYSINDLVSGNPWNEALGLSILPVYQNPGNYFVNGGENERDMATMQAWAVEVAERLGLSPEEYTVTDNSPSDKVLARLKEKFTDRGEEVPAYLLEATQAVVTADGIEISVDARLEATIRLNPAVALPSQYTFAHHATYEETLAVGNYLLQAYPNLLDMEQPVLAIQGGDYTINDDQGYSIHFYEGAGTPEEQIVHYNLARATFSCDDSGELFIIRLRKGDPTKKLGDYPIITVEEARTLLSQGHYLTTVPTEFPGLDAVGKVELIYRSGWDRTLLPYYRFYAEVTIPGQVERIHTIFGAYYVPAVAGEYISNMPLWDGTFN